MHPLYPAYIPTHRDKENPYKADQGKNNDESRAQKFMLPESMFHDLDWLSSQHNSSKTEIVREALYQYFSQSHFWNNKRHFVAPAKKYNFDKKILSEFTNTTTVDVIWANEPDSPYEHYAFVSCRVLQIKENSLILNPLFYLPLSISRDEMDVNKSERVAPGFIDFDPKAISSPAYLTQLKYEVEFKYLWNIRV